MIRDSVDARFLAPVDAELSARIAWRIQLRWVAVVGTLVVITVADVLLPGVLPMVPLIGVTAFVGIYNVIFYVYAHALQYQTDLPKRLTLSTRFAYVQIGLDLVCLTLLLHFSGGVENLFCMFYVLHIIISSILLQRRAALAYALLATVLYGGLIALEYFSLIPHVHLAGVVGSDWYRRERFLIMAGVAFVTTLFFAAFMATTIMACLRARDRELVKANQRNEGRARELAELNRRLEEADETRRKSIRLVTHELRAPVAAIQSYLRLILGGYASPERHREILARTERPAAEQLDRINDLLVLSRLHEEQATTEQVDLGEVLGQVLDVMRGPAEEKELTLSVDVDAGAPSLLANRDQIHHVWMNLVSNAIKYTPKGGAVEITLSQEPAYVVGMVKDTGIGIAPADQVKIFDEFYRAEQAKQLEPHGTGLGLAIVKRIVEEYKGRVEVESSPGEGALFKFKLPKTGALSTSPCPESGEETGA